jgi:AcrR family transcriptional regulator
MPRVAAVADVREAILDAAMHLMEDYGYKKMTMDDIAAEARIGKATIYGYFDSKEDVAISVFDRKWRVCAERWREAACPAAPPDTRLRQMLVAHVLYGFDNVQRHKKTLDETLASLRHLVMPKREQYLDQLALLLAEVLRDGCEQGLFVCDDPQVVARTLVTCVSALSPTNLSARELGERDEIETRTHQIVDLALNGLRRRAERTGP